MLQNQGRPQTIWGWPIAAYLFLAGMGAGAYVVGVAADFAGDGWRFFAQTGITLGPPVVAISTLFLVFDLGRPMRSLRAAFRPQTSWISRGFIILTAFIVVGIVHLLLWVATPALDDADVARRILGVVGGVLGVMTMLYTALLLGVVRSISLWSTPVLPVLFGVSALSTGIMAVAGVAAVSRMFVSDIQVGEEATLVAADAALLALEAMVVTSYLYLMSSLPSARASRDVVVRGSLAPTFWLGFVAVGLLVPFVVELLLVDVWADLGPGAHLAVTMVAVTAGLIGGFLLRLLVVTGGIREPLTVIGKSAFIPARPRLLP